MTFYFPMDPNALLPPPPDLVLRLGFAGNRKLPGGPERLDNALDEILPVIVRALTGVRERASRDGDDAALIARHYSSEPPCLRLVTGLAEGGDERAAAALDRLRDHAPLRTELAAILPFDTRTYRDSRAADFQASFDVRHGQCAYVLELDGIHDAPTDDETLRSRRHARAYRAQAAVLLRHADILIAAADLQAPARPGGTLETVADALAFDTPVVLVSLGDDPAPGGQTIRLLEPGAPFRDALADPEASSHWQEHLTQWVQRIVADPDFVPETPEGTRDDNEVQRRQSEQFVVEYLTSARCPRIDTQGKRRPSFREWVWTVFEGWFRDASNPTSDPRLEPFGRYRDRATSLNYHFSGLYRGAFVLNYALAVVTVCLAALDLVLIGMFGAAHHEVLLALACCKLVLLIYILRSTTRANNERWNDKSIDYRYLAERLRTMFYLPRLGSFQSPSAAPLNYASRFARQSGIDWLFEAICRSVSPASLATATVRTAPDGPAVPTLRLDVDRALADVRAFWIGAEKIDAKDEPGAKPAQSGAGQILYHQRNANTMRRLHTSLEKCVHVLNSIVILVVAVDVLAILCGWDHHHEWTPWLIFAAAVLPAAVASLNGLRFQSECQRLADRSRAILRLLKGQALAAANLQDWLARNQSDPATAVGAASVKVLTRAESVAKNLVDEVAEWSVLYAKDVTHI